MEIIYNRDNCPQSEDWFIRGGKCGWAHCCDQCEMGPTSTPAEDFSDEIAELNEVVGTITDFISCIDDFMSEIETMATEASLWKVKDADAMQAIRELGMFQERLEDKLTQFKRDIRDLGGEEEED